MIGDGDRNKVSSYDHDDDGNEHCGILGKIYKHNEVGGGA